MGTYVVGDIHGCYNEWIKLKNRIEKLDKDATFILVGDIIDRGNQTLEMLDWALNNITDNGKYQMVVGNHEDMKRHWFSVFELQDKRVLCRYDFDFVMRNVERERILKYKAFLERLSYYKDIKVQSSYNGKLIHYCVVHANMRSKLINENGELNKDKIQQYLERFKNIKFSEQYPNSLLLDRYYDINDNDNIIVVHGHTPTLGWETAELNGLNGRILYAENDINVDCGCVFKEKDSNLAAIRLEDLEEFYLYNNNVVNDTKARRKLLKKIGKQ